MVWSFRRLYPRGMPNAVDGESDRGDRVQVIVHPKAVSLRVVNGNSCARVDMTMGEFQDMVKEVDEAHGASFVTHTCQDSYMKMGAAEDCPYCSKVPGMAMTT